MTTVYLAYSASATATLALHARDAAVDLLVAYPMLPGFLKERSRFNIGRWCLDSGAFSVHNSGKTIDNREYTERALDVDADEVFGLDVIGSHDDSRRNLEASWRRGLKAIPTYHIGEPEESLLWYAENSEKIALGGIAKAGKSRYNWLEQCVARVWPKKVHAFGAASWEAVRCAPFDSVDASSWAFAPRAMGQWAGFSGHQRRVPCKGEVDLWVEVEEHRKRAEWAKWRWAKELVLARNP